MSFSVFGADEVVRLIDTTIQKTKDAVVAGVRDSTVLAYGEIKNSIAGRRAETKSVDTGRLLNSIEYEYNSNQGKVFSKLEYAPYLEYGTSKITPRRHFRNSLARKRNEINKIMQDKISSATKVSISQKRVGGY